jgi:hypothetical protein
MRIRLVGGWVKRAGIRGQERIRFLTAATLFVIAAAVGIEICRAARIVPELPADAAGILALGLAAVAILVRDSGIVALLDRLDMFRWALDAAPSAQLIVEATGGSATQTARFACCFRGRSDRRWKLCSKPSLPIRNRWSDLAAFAAASWPEPRRQQRLH